jgi:hypothetical protein
MIARALVCCFVLIGGVIVRAADPVLPIVERVARQPLVAQVRGIMRTGSCWRRGSGRRMMRRRLQRFSRRWIHFA